MNHFQTSPQAQAHAGAFARQQLTPTKPASVAAPPLGLSQAELRDIVLAILG